MNKSTFLAELASNFDIKNVKTIKQVYFWSIGCDACKSILNKLKSDQNESIITIHVPLSERDLDKDKINKYLEERNLNLPIYFDNEHSTFSKTNSNYLPLLISIDEYSEKFKKIFYIEDIEKELGLNHMNI